MSKMTACGDDEATRSLLHLPSEIALELGRDLVSGGNLRLRDDREPLALSVTAPRVGEPSQRALRIER